MKNQFSLNIKTPCQAHFSQFASTPNGGFCNLCTKEVIDFTKMNAQEISNYFNKRENENICGKFKSNQLNTNYQKTQQSKILNIISGIGLVCLSLFSFTVQAQSTPIQNENLGEQAEIKHLKSEKSVTVKGNITNESSALPGVNVYLQGSESGTQTDFDGNFEFPEKLKAGDVLVFTAIGMKSQKVVIENKSNLLQIALSIDMKYDSVILMGKIAIKEIYKSKKNKNKLQ